MTKRAPCLLGILLLGYFLSGMIHFVMAEEIPIVTLPGASEPSTSPSNTPNTSTEKPEKKAKIKKEKQVKTPKPPKETSTSSAQTATFKGTKNVGARILAYAEFSQLNGLHALSGSDMGTITTMGYGLNIFTHFGLADRWRMAVDAGYSRQSYANKFKTLSARNYFNSDVLAHYLLSTKSEKFIPYAIGGAGIILSSSGVAPVLDLGIGLDVALNQKFFISTQLLYKTAIIHHRVEPSIGIGIKF